MAWVAVDRAIKDFERFKLPGPLDRWRALRDEIHAHVCEHGFNASVGTFVQTFGSTALDASLLLIPLLGFLPASDPRVIATIEAIERDLVVDSFRLGARGIFCRDSSFKTLAKCILSVHRGHVWISNMQLEFLLDLLIKMKPTQLIKTDGMRVLTQREQQIVHLVAEGLRNKDIAAKLGISEHTAKNYIFRIFEKLGLSTRVELVIYALSQPEPLSS